MKTQVDVFGAALTRRSFVRAGGALMVGFGLVGADGLKNAAQAAPTKNTLDPKLPESWIVGTYCFNTTSVSLVSAELFRRFRTTSTARVA
jgi:hypothetical protein